MYAVYQCVPLYDIYLQLPHVYTLHTYYTHTCTRTNTPSHHPTLHPHSKRPPVGTPYVEMFKTLFLAAKKRKYPLPSDPLELYEKEDEYYVANAFHRMPHTTSQRWLDHAAVQGEGIVHKKTVTQVEEIKQLGRLLPIACVAIIYQCIYCTCCGTIAFETQSIRPLACIMCFVRHTRGPLTAQMYSLFVIQGDSLQGPPDAAMMTTWDIVRHCQFQRMHTFCRCPFYAFSI